jgi:uncharacterized protein YjbI with pentapeptide repeats
MANSEHLEILKQGGDAWNNWRRNSRIIKPDLSGADLSGLDLIELYLNDTNLSKVNLTNANLSKANLIFANLAEADLGKCDFIDANLNEADFRNADLCYANLNDADLSNANLTGANLVKASLSKARLIGATFESANLYRANLSEADLSHANLSKASLVEAKIKGVDFNSADFTDMDLSGATIGWTTFSNNNFITVKGLTTIHHSGPSTIGIDTMYKSGGRIPEIFLLGCGVPNDFITFLPSLIGAEQAIHFYSCFISYSHKDEVFARRLYSRMREANLRVWYAPEEIKGGQKLHEQIFSAIQVHDKLLLVLSEDSLKSEWVATEIRRARRVEREENRRKLFPIRLVNFDAIQQWECFDADSGKDLAVELREYFIPDFSNWKDHDAFEKAFDRLLRDLKAEEK